MHVNDSIASVALLGIAATAVVVLLCLQNLINSFLSSLMFLSNFPCRTFSLYFTSANSLNLASGEDISG